MKHNIIQKLNFKILDLKIKNLSKSLVEERLQAYNIYLEIDNYGLHYMINPERLIKRLIKYEQIHGNNIEKYCNILGFVEQIEDSNIKKQYLNKVKTEYQFYNNSITKYMKKTHDLLNNANFIANLSTINKENIYKVLSMLDAFYFIDVSNDSNPIKFFEDLPEVSIIHY